MNHPNPGIDGREGKAGTCAGSGMVQRLWRHGEVSRSGIGQRPAAEGVAPRRARSTPRLMSDFPSPLISNRARGALTAEFRRVGSRTEVVGPHETGGYRLRLPRPTAARARP